MAFGQLSPDILQAITIAVGVNGQATLAGFQAQLNQVTVDINAQKAAMAGATVVAQAQIDKLEELVTKQRVLQASVAATRTAMSGLPAGFSLSGQAALSLSYALDDLQYGFSAIVNNAPHLALALGVGPGVAGALGALFVVLNQVTKHLPEVNLGFKTMAREAGLISDPIRDAAGSIDGLKSRIQAINDNPIKTEASIDAVRKLTEEVKVATRAQEHWDRLKDSRTDAQKEAARQVDSAIEESGAARPLSDILREQGRKKALAPGSELHGQIANEEATIAFYSDPARSEGFANQVSGLAALGRLRIGQARSKIAELRSAMETEVDQKVGEMVGLTRGEGSRTALLGTIDRPEVAGELEKAGVDLLRLRSGIENAAPDRIFADERRKIAQATEKKDAARQHALDVERARARAEMEKAMDEGEKTEARNAYAYADARLAEEYGEDRRDKKAEAEKKRADAAAARDARNAQGTPAQARRRDEAAYGQEFQARARGNMGVPVSGQQAAFAGKQVAQMVGSGVDVDSAMEQAFVNLQMLVRSQQMTALKNAAAWNRLNGFAEQAMVQEQFVRQQQDRLQVQRQSLLNR